LGSLLQVPALGHVPRNLAEALQLAVLVVDCAQDHIRPEHGPILSDTPALILEPPLGSRNLQLPRGPIRRKRFGGVKTGKMLADNLASGVTLEALGPGVPGHDVPVRVQHENRVIAYAVYEEPITLFALP